MSNKLQTAAVAFLIFLSTLCSAQVPKATVQESLLNNQGVIVVSIAFPNGRTLDLACNVGELACEMPLAGTKVSVLTDHIFFHIYAGPEARLTWGSSNENIGAYVIRASN